MAWKGAIRGNNMQGSEYKGGNGQLTARVGKLGIAAGRFPLYETCKEKGKGKRISTCHNVSVLISHKSVFITLRSQYNLRDSYRQGCYIISNYSSVKGALFKFVARKTKIFS